MDAFFQKALIPVGISLILQSPGCLIAVINQILGKNSNENIYKAYAAIILTFLGISVSVLCVLLPQYIIDKVFV